MKWLALILISLSIASCIPKAADDSTSASLKAVYLIQKEAQLSSEDLQAHPEVVVVQTFDEFKKYASRKTALWIDKSATPFNSDQEKWINEAPQAYYPIVLVGYGDTLYSFRDLLRLCCFTGPIIEWELESGFSVIQREETPDPTTEPIDVTFLQGYDQKPTVQAILQITNALLEGRLNPMPTVTFIPVATATPAVSTIIVSPDLIANAHIAVAAIETNQPEMLRSRIEFQRLR